jgi:hypothetical protein
VADLRQQNLHFTSFGKFVLEAMLEREDAIGNLLFCKASHDFVQRGKSRVQATDSRRLQVDDLKQQISGFMSAKKSFREVTLEGEIAQLKGQAEDAAIPRVRLGEVERRLQNAEYREQKHVTSFCHPYLRLDLIFQRMCFS